MIRILALDLDDTLLTEELGIGEEDAEAVRAAEEMGVTVLLASGRTLFSMKPYVERLGMWGREGYMIANNGATVLSTLDRSTLIERTLDPEIGLEVWRAARRYGLTMQYYGDGEIFCSGPSPYTEEDCRLTGQVWKVVDPFEESLLQPRTKFVVPGDPSILPGVESELKERLGEEANIFISKPYFLEVLRSDADKGTALQFIADECGVSASEVMAVGDSMNDYGMVRWAGTGVAIANAHPSIIRVADFVTERSHQDCGVAEAIRRFIPRVGNSHSVHSHP
jgi:Cof subfamily protein (haloacid dehalogenase superfamily)